MPRRVESSSESEEEKPAVKHHRHVPSRRAAASGSASPRGKSSAAKGRNPVRSSRDPVDESADDEVIQLEDDADENEDLAFQPFTPPSQPDLTKFDFGIEIPEERLGSTSTEQQNSTRLCIKTIWTKDFKSYYGKKILGPFDQKFTAIVGPNGCGKSNTIDALLFVFGYQSRKLRTSKLQELIHNSAAHSNCDSAIVTVSFVVMKPVRPGEEPSSSDKLEEFSISRAVNRKGVAGYYMDGRKANRADVVARLKMHNVDLDHNRFLILQGEVEQISLMKPTDQSEHGEGMLEYLEDIIGSNRYKQPIQKFEELIGELHGEKENAVVVHTGLIKDMKVMRPEKLKAEKYLQLEGEFHQLDHQLNQVRIYQIKNAIEELTEQVQTKRDFLTERETALAALKSREETWLKEQSTYDNQLKEVRAAEEQLRSEQQRCESEKTRAEQELKSRKQAGGRVGNDISHLKADIEDLKKKTVTDKESKVELLEKEKDLEEKISTETEKFTVAQGRVAGLTENYREEKEGVEEQKRVVERKLNEQVMACDAKKNELNLVRSDVTAAENRVNDISKRLDDAEESVQRLEMEKGQSDGRMRELQLEITQMEGDQRNLTQQKNTLQEELRRIRQQLGSLQEVRHNVDRVQSRDAAINELLDCKRNGTIPGIYGRLGDLGAVDKKYEIAASAIGGRSLDMVVVDTVHSSKACMEQLKRSGRGRASIMVLEQMARKMNPSWINSTRRYPENCPRLFDLVRVEDDALRPAFYYIFRDCLVADNLEQGDRVHMAGGSSRHKVITLRGEIFDASGAMTGGGNANDIEIRIGHQVVQHAAPPVQNNRAEIEALEQKQQPIVAQLAALTSDLSEMSIRLPLLVREKTDLTNRIRIATSELTRARESMTSLPTSLAQAQAALENCHVNKREETKLSVEIAVLDEKVAKIEAERDGLAEEIQEIDKKIWDIRGEEVNESEKKLKKYRKKMDETKKEITRLTGAIAGDERSVVQKQKTLEKKENSVSEVREKVETLEATVAELKERLKEAVEGVDKNRREIQSLERNMKHGKSKLEGVQEEMEGVEKVVDTLKAEIKEREDKTKAYEKRFKELQPKLEKIESLVNTRKYVLPLEFRTLSVTEIERADKDELKAKMDAKRKKLDGMEVNLAILDDHAAAREKVENHAATLRSQEEKYYTARAWHDKLCKDRKAEFTESFEKIQKKLKETYHALTLGGDAELYILDVNNPFRAGIEFSVRPPNKSYKAISNLSGGEKTLSSLALIFALHHYKPTPFYIMDEIDAALDYRNVTIAGKYVKDRTLDAQFIIVSLRPNMYQQAARHVGIYKIDDVTQVALLSHHAYANIPLLPPQENPAQEKRSKRDRQNRSMHSGDRSDRKMYSAIVASLFPKSKDGKVSSPTGKKRSATEADLESHDSGSVPRSEMSRVLRGE